MSNSRAEMKTPDQGSLFGVLATGSKVAGLRSGDGAAGSFILRPLGENRKQLRKVATGIPQKIKLSKKLVYGVPHCLPSLSNS